MSKTIIVTKEMLMLFEDNCVCPSEDLYNEITAVTDAIDKVNGEGDYFDCLLVDKDMLTMMRDVWYGRRESFTVTLTPDSVEVM
ncbi:hypothetical protein D3C87_1099020 [compost metagenome]